MSGPFTKFTARNRTILAALRSVAEQLGRPLARVALAWVAAQPGITAPIIGANRVAQIHDNLGVLDLAFSPGQLYALSTASAPEPVFTCAIFRSELS